MKDTTIFDNCPVYKSGHFKLRLVEQEDAENLHQCYSDPSAVRLMNSDNCSCDFYFKTLNEMTEMIRGWIGAYESRWGAYEGGACIRFSIIDTQNNTAVGTIEMFDKTKDIGILRLDLCSAYEKQDYLIELIELATEKFHNAFGVKQILTKAIAEAAVRIYALQACGYNSTVIPRGDIWWTWIDGKKVRDRKLMPYGDYYVHDGC
ncbi:MAG: GNAT family N-acetyltransferase [Armatimonadota bacterium]